MRTIGFDHETCLIRPGVQAPEMVCTTFAERVDGRLTSGIERWDRSEDLLASWLDDDNVLLTGAHTAFDACVGMANFPRLVDKYFRAYDLDRVRCVQNRDRLLDIAAGRFQGFHTSTGGWVKPTYDLAALAARHLGVQMSKGSDTYRLRYQELLYVPISEWPEEALRYCILDAENTLLIDEHQEPHAEEFLGEQYNIARKALALQLKSVWGFRTSRDGVIALRDKAVSERERIRAGLEEDGLVRADGTRDIKATKKYMIQVCKDLGIKVQLTDTGLKKLQELKAAEKPDVVAERMPALEEEYAALGEDVCVETGDEVLKAYAAFGRWGSTISKDVTALAKGTIHPIHSRPGMAATTRTTESSPNTQNWGVDWGPRECIVPRTGCVFIQADYPQLELKTLAQTCIDLFGYSAMADAINAGQDLHLKFASVVLGITYEEAERTKDNKDVKNARNLGKVNNFGRPGGLGDKNLVAYAKKNFKLSLGDTEEEAIAKAKEMKEQWFAAFPEMRDYFAYMGQLCNNPSGLGEIRIPRSKQLRGGAMYCALCNTPFQGLGAVCSGRALWLIAKACYVDRSSVLFGSRNVFHVHDENILECPNDDLVHERAMELARLMDVGANEFLVDVPMKTDPQAMAFWSKEAFTLKNSRGRIIAWNGEWKCEECKGVFQPPHRKGVKKCAAHMDAPKYELTA